MGSASVTSAGSPASSAASFKQSATLVALATVTFVLVALAVNGALRLAKPGLFAPFWKVELAAADPETNTVFIGTSRVEEGFDPEPFDRAMEASGVGGIHSYNVGRSDELFSEAEGETETLFQLKPSGMKFVFLEPNYLTGVADSDFIMNSMRMISHYTLGHAFFAATMLDFPDYPANPDPMKLYAARLGRIVAAVLRHYFSIGLAWATPEPSWTYLTTPRGFWGSTRQFQPAKLDDYRTHLKDLATAPPQEKLYSQQQLDLLLSFARKINAHGAVPIMVGMPQGGTLYTAALIKELALACPGDGPLYLDFTSPQQYPELFTPENRADIDHLNSAGAAIFARLLAERVATALKDGSLSRPLCRS